MAIGSGVLLPGVAENPPFPILSALAYTTGLGYRPTCEKLKKYYHDVVIYRTVWANVKTDVGSKHPLGTAMELTENIASDQHQHFQPTADI